MCERERGIGGGEGEREGREGVCERGRVSVCEREGEQGGGGRERGCM